MDQLPENKKRIVSKGQYLWVQSKRISLNVTGCGLVGLACLCVVVMGAGIVGLLIYDRWWQAVGFLLLSWPFVYFLRKMGYRSFQKAETIDPVIPLTHQTASTLSDEESLVRASEEPIQEQQAILLRAATDNQETSADQLVRPAGKPER